MNNMKKTIILGMSLVMASLMTYAATPTTAMIKVLINSASSISGDNLMMAEGPSWSSAKDNGYDGPKNIIAGNLQMWIPAPWGEQLGTFGTNNLANTPIMVQTIGDSEYTFTFDKVSGNQYRFFDAEADSVFDITNTAKYVVSLPQADIIENRFFIVAPFSPNEGELVVCHENDQLVINNNPYTQNIVVKNEAGEVVLNKMPFATPQFISLESLDAGHYTVEFGGGEKKYIIAVKPKVETETPAVP